MWILRPVWLNLRNPSAVPTDVINHVQYSNFKDCKRKWWTISITNRYTLHLSLMSSISYSAYHDIVIVYLVMTYMYIWQEYHFPWYFYNPSLWGSGIIELGKTYRVLCVLICLYTNNKTEQNLFICLFGTNWSCWWDAIKPQRVSISMTGVPISHKALYLFKDS